MKDLATQRMPGINTYSYIWTLPAHECLQGLMDGGYREFELMIHPPHLSFDRSTADYQALRRLLATSEAQVHSLNLPSLDTNLASAFSDMRAYSQGMFRKALELCSSLEIPYLVTVPGRVSPLFPPDRSVTRDLMQRSIEALLPDAERLGVKLAIENVPFASFPDADSVVDFVTAMASPHLAVVYDVANAHFIGEDPVKGLETVGDYLAVVHFSDTTQTSWRHDPVGDGDVDFTGVCAALDGMSWSGPVMMEIVSRDPARDIERSRAALAGHGFSALKGE